MSLVFMWLLYSKRYAYLAHLMIQDGGKKEKDKWRDIKSLGKWKPAADSLTVLVTGLEVRILLHHLCAVRPAEQSGLFPDLLRYTAMRDSRPVDSHAYTHSSITF